MNKLWVIRDIEQDFDVINEVLRDLTGKYIPVSEKNKKEAFNYLIREVYEKHRGIPEQYITRWDTDEINEVFWHLYSYGVT